MKTIDQRTCKRLLLAGVVVAVGLILCDVLFGGCMPLPGIPNLTLAVARARWEASDIHSYHARVFMGSHSFIAWVEVTVRNDVLVESDGLDWGPQDDEAFNPENYTIDALFNLAERGIDNPEFPTDQWYVEYDGQYGYPLILRNNCGNGWGLFCSRIGSCESSYRVEEFEPMEE